MFVQSEALTFSSNQAMISMMSFLRMKRNLESTSEERSFFSEMLIPMAPFFGTGIRTVTSLSREGRNVLSKMLMDDSCSHQRMRSPHPAALRKKQSNAYSNSKDFLENPSAAPLPSMT